MEFCEKCSSVLISDRDSKGSFLTCRKCGGKQREYTPVQISEKVQKDPREEVIVIEKTEEPLPKTKTDCGKCGNKEAYWWIQQTRSADEAPTLFLRCAKCKHSWREYG